jgi:hypothetical protein
LARDRGLARPCHGEGLHGSLHVHDESLPAGHPTTFVARGREDPQKSFIDLQTEDPGAQAQPAVSGREIAQGLTPRPPGPSWRCAHRAVVECSADDSGYWLGSATCCSIVSREDTTEGSDGWDVLRAPGRIRSCAARSFDGKT